MNMQDIKSIAKEYGIKTGKLKKVELVQSIQIAEGNFDCFTTAAEKLCDQLECLWREDCFTLASK